MVAINRGEIGKDKYKRVMVKIQAAFLHQMY